MLHAHHTFVSLFINVLENIFIVDFSGSRFVPSRIVTDLDVGYFFPAEVHIPDQVTLIPLHVIDIVQYFAGRAVVRPAYHLGLIGMSQEKLGSVAQRFKNHDQAVGLEDFGTDPQRIIAGWKAIPQRRETRTGPPLWDGQAAVRIVDVLEKYFETGSGG